METVYYSRMDSPVGSITVCCSAKGLLRVELGPAVPEGGRGDFQYVESREETRPAVEQLEEYLTGRRTRFTLPLDLRGTPFQRKVWAALLEIPYGETRSYADIARAIGQPRAFRAVGMANHHNPVCIIVPCHRVVASDGSLCGYGGGLPMKQYLLDLERGAAADSLLSPKAAAAAAPASR